MKVFLNVETELGYSFGYAVVVVCSESIVMFSGWKWLTFLGPRAIPYPR